MNRFFAILLLGGAMMLAPRPAAAEQPSGSPARPATPAAPPGVAGSRQSLFDAWLAADAVVLGTYRGVDSTLGTHVRILDVENVWMGTPSRGRLVFKAPRGVRGEPGSKMLLFLWDRLAGASDSFLEESKSRYGKDVWQRIGPDSIAIYLLPFSAWSFPYTGQELLLRGQGAFPVKLPIADLATDLQKYEKSLAPQQLFAKSAVAMRGRVSRAELADRSAHGEVVERWVLLEVLRLETLKGQAPDTLSLRFISVPRSPRFKPNDEVILFLAQGPEGLYLDQGKRSVLHVVKGEVLEEGKPLAEFLKTLRSP